MCLFLQRILCRLDTKKGGKNEAKRIPVQEEVPNY